MYDFGSGDLFWSLFVRHLSLTFSFKHHLLLNHRTNSIQISQECSIDGPLSKLFKDLNSIENFGGKMSKILKSSPLNLHVRFQYSLVEMFLGWPYTNIVQGILISWKKRQSGGIRKGAKWQNLEIPFFWKSLSDIKKIE